MLIIQEYLDQIQEQDILQEGRFGEAVADIARALGITSLVFGGYWSAADIALGFPEYLPLDSGIALAGLMIYLASKVYTRYRTEGGKACKGVYGDAFDECLSKFRDSARKQEISSLIRGKTLCAKSKEPEKCKAKIDKRVNELKNILKGVI